MALAELPGDEATAMLTDALGDTDATIRRHAALALGARRVTRAVPTLLGLVVEGPNDVEAAELLGTLARDAKWADRIMGALADELAAHTADSAVRMRLTQALAEMPGTIALNILRQLAHDEDRPVALIASALVRVLEERPDEEPQDGTARAPARYSSTASSRGAPRPATDRPRRRFPRHRQASRSRP